ncbi:MAG: tRNA (5-methylaminomethyl-2-thiouridine)(34)-methyltransferase MnmD [Castellaniella sp.]
MSGPYQPLIPAVWHQTADGIPDSERYGDVYHGQAGPLAQAQQVFLRGNHLPGRWQGRAAFTICETGFGLGHNFLASWHAWRSDPQRSQRLHYLAFEAHPFEAQDLRRVWRCLPAALQDLADELAHAWPALLPGVQRLDLAGGKVSLTLAWGDIRRTVRQAQAAVDAFYLDGFAPDRNPEMWSPGVFGQMRRLACTGATVATWCAAGQVRRDLQSAGFLVSRVPGFAGKRHMTVATLRPGLGQALPDPQRRRVAVIGGGLAGAGVAQALAARGHEVQVWDSHCALDIKPEVRQYGAAALVPALSLDDDTRSRLSRVGLQRDQSRWMGLPEPAKPNQCGALVCAGNQDDAQRQQAAMQRLQFPPGWVRWLDNAAASRQAGVPLAQGGLWFDQALRVCPGELIAALLSQPGVTRRAIDAAALRAHPDGGWCLLDQDQRVLDRVDEVVLANARHAPALLALHPLLSAWPVLSGLRPIAGQISLYATCDDSVPACILSGKGYCLPPAAGLGVAGSTYRPRAGSTVVDETGHRAILAQLRRWLPAGSVPWLGRGQPQGWAGWRAATRDHLPIIDAVAEMPGVWLACGYGSRGLSWSALAGDLIAARLDREPWPVERELQHRIRLR